MNNLKELHHIQEVLRSSGYFDVQRISNEIQEFVERENISLDSVLERISSNEPWEYINGYAYFKGYNFRVNNHVLIPRPETEVLVDLAKENIADIHNIVDIGTGSGCIITSLFKDLEQETPTLLENIRFIGTDISKDALVVAKENGEETNIEFIQTDLIEGLELEGNTLLLANLPYIPTDIYLELDPSVKDFEPKLALDGGIDGLDIYRELLKQIQFNCIKGILLLEFEPSTQEDIVKLFTNYTCQILKDQYQMERFLKVLIP